MPRPSRREGFSWKFFHPLRPSIHATRVGFQGSGGGGGGVAHQPRLLSRPSQGPKGELWLNLLRMPSDHCIFRVASDEEGQSWLEAFREATYGAHPSYHHQLDMDKDMGDKDLSDREQEGADDSTLRATSSTTLGRRSSNNRDDADPR